MGLITRAEASHRLRIVSTKISSATTAARDGNWPEGALLAAEARALLDALIPHLDEAAESNDTFAVFNATPPAQRVGGMGYRGSHNPMTTAPTPAPPIARERKSSVAPPKPIAIITPPPAPKPIVTPPPAPVVAPLPEKVMFDLKRISGMPEWFISMKQNPPAPSLSDEEWALTELFDTLSLEARAGVTGAYRRNDTPVLYNLKTGEIG